MPLGGHFPIPSLLLHQEPGLERRILQQIDDTLVPQHYEGRLARDYGSIVIQGRYSCGSFTLVMCMYTAKCSLAFALSDD